jgi:hypothetical protein
MSAMEAIPAAPAGRPEADGSLAVAGPSILSRFDMGNARVFATFDGEGSLRRGSLVEGYDLGTWRTALTVDGEILAFARARAIGRLWVLSADKDGLEVELSSFLDECSPAIYQRLLLRNRSGRGSSAAIRLDMRARSELSLKERLEARGARLVARLPGTARWWARSGAKKIRPYASRRLLASRDGLVRAPGRMIHTWRANSPPALIKRRGGGAAVLFKAQVEASKELELLWVVAAGGDAECALCLENGRSALESALGYADWLGGRYSGGDVFLKSLHAAGLNAAISMFKEFPGGFAGLVAGPDYGYPPRLYFRDGYWTAQALLDERPELVRRHILSIARGVHLGGQCPSGVFAPHVLRDHAGGCVESLDWLPDHYDSPSLFVLLVSDYVEATGDWALLDESIPLWAGRGREPRFAGLWSLARAAIDYLAGKDRDGLLEKPHAANDWADNVKRSLWVAYDQALYAAALLAVARMAGRRGEDGAVELYRRLGTRARDALNEKLWDEGTGHFINYARPGFVEGNFSIDSLVALRYGLVDEDKVERLLLAARRLQTRDNEAQPHGDWGVMSVCPGYGLASDLFSKSSLALCYHNGADWPYWDGVYAGVLLERGDPEWRYVLGRWWEYGLSRGWLTPVEYYSPAYEPGGMLQGWSAMPAAVCSKAWGRPKPPHAAGA